MQTRENSLYCCPLLNPCIAISLNEHENKRQIEPSENTERSLFPFFLPFLADITKVTMVGYVPKGGVLRHLINTWAVLSIETHVD